MTEPPVPRPVVRALSLERAPHWQYLDAHWIRSRRIASDGRLTAVTPGAKNPLEQTSGELAQQVCQIHLPTRRRPRWASSARCGFLCGSRPQLRQIRFLPQGSGAENDSLFAVQGGVRGSAT